MYKIQNKKMQNTITYNVPMWGTTLPNLSQVKGKQMNLLHRKCHKNVWLLQNTMWQILPIHQWKYSLSFGGENSLPLKHQANFSTMFSFQLASSATHQAWFVSVQVSSGRSLTLSNAWSVSSKNGITPAKIIIIYKYFNIIYIYIIQILCVCLSVCQV